MPLEYSSQSLEDLKTLTILRYYLQCSHLTRSHHGNQISKTKLLCYTMAAVKLSINSRNKVSLLLNFLLQCFKRIDLQTGRVAVVSSSTKITGTQTSKSRNNFIFQI